jgi:hypothetical protein
MKKTRLFKKYQNLSSLKSVRRFEIIKQKFYLFQIVSFVLLFLQALKVGVRFVVAVGV